MDYMQAPPRVADQLYRERRERLVLLELPESLAEVEDWPELPWGLAWFVAGRWRKRQG